MQAVPLSQAEETTSRGGPVRLPTTALDYGLEGKRVAMVSFSAFPSDPRPRRAAEALLDAGMSVDFVCLADEGFPRRESTGRLNIRRVAIKHRRGGPLSYAYQYSAFILASTVLCAIGTLRRHYDLVYVHNMPDVLVFSAVVPKALGAKVILDQHDPMPELMTTIFKLRKDSFAVRAMQYLEKWSIGCADLVLTVNMACKRIFENRSCRSEKIGIVMNAPDEKIFGSPGERFLPTARAEDTGTYVIMYHGSVVERNGLDLAIDALAQVRTSIPGAQLRVYGRRTPFLETVMNQARDKRLQDQVQYLGFRSLEKLVPEIQACDLGVIPNHESDFAKINTPTRIFEYLSLGKPVIAPRTSGITDYFDQNSLLFFNPGDTSDLAEKMKFAYWHPSEVGEIAARGHEVYREHCWERERKRLLGLVAGLLCRSDGNRSSTNDCGDTIA